ncbi:MAG: hypothetical protein WC248_06965 [Candidatus Methanomethylophilaceae archaeon]|jgi:hypothetical protein
MAERKPGVLNLGEVPAKTKAKEKKKKETAVSYYRGQKLGEEFERSWADSMKYYKAWGHKIETGFAGTPFDFFFFTTKRAFALELKSTMDGRLLYSRIRPNQRQGLEAAYQETNGFLTSAILIRHKTLNINRIFYVPWETVREHVLSGVPGSIDGRDFECIEQLHFRYTKNEKEIKEWVWDLGILGAEPKDEYTEVYRNSVNRLFDLRRGVVPLTPEQRAEAQVYFDIIKSRLLKEAEAQAAAMGVSTASIIASDKPVKKLRYPATRAPSNGPIRNPKTWGGGRGIGKHPDKRSKNKSSGDQVPERYPPEAVPETDNTDSD